MKFHYELLPEAKRQHLSADQSNLGFGLCRTNHIFLMDFSNGEWHDPRIVPYAPLSLAPGAVSLHYGQTIFEGGKAFLHDDGELYAFRYDKNIARLNHSANVICMPPVPEDIHMEALLRLLDIERDWCPTAKQASIYIRPFMIATSDCLAVRPSESYTFCIMLSPSGPYYSGGFSKAVRLLISTQYHRAVTGGTGTAKTGGNYAASMLATEVAAQKGADQVLYLDSTNTYVEEAGAMNHYHVLRDGTFIIPKFNDTILESITSLSTLALSDMGKVKARQEIIRLDTLLEGIRSGEIIEAGGLGTAAVVSPTGSYLLDDGTIIPVGDGKPGKYSSDLYELYTGMQTGKTPAPDGWLQKIPRYSR